MSSTRSKTKKGEDATSIETTEVASDFERIVKDILLKEFQNFKASLTKEIKELVKQMQQDIYSKLHQMEENTSAMKDMMHSFQTSLEFTQKQLEDLNVLKDKLENEVIDLRKKFDDLEENINNLERYSRSFNLRFNGIPESDDGDEDCIKLVGNVLQSLGIEDGCKEIENAHRTGRVNSKFSGRQIIAKFFRRPLRMAVLKATRGQNAKESLGKVRVMEDFTPVDFLKRKKALPMMAEAFKEGKKVRFTRGRLVINGESIKLS